MVNINKRVIYPIAMLTVASISLYIAYKMYLKDKYVDPGKGSAVAPGGKSTSFWGSETYKPPKMGTKGVDFEVKNVATGMDKVTNKHTGRMIYMYCSRRKHQDNKYAVKDRNKCTQWKVGSGATLYKSRVKMDVMQTAYRMTL